MKAWRSFKLGVSLLICLSLSACVGTVVGAAAGGQQEEGKTGEAGAERHAIVLWAWMKATVSSRARRASGIGSSIHTWNMSSYSR